MDPKQLREERAAIWKQMEEIITSEDKFEDNPAEAREKYDALEKDLDAKTADIERAERFEEKKKDLEQRVEEPVVVQTPTGPKEIKQERYDAAAEKWMRSGFNGLDDEDREILRGYRPEVRAQAVGTDSAGGYLVPTGFRASLMEAQKAFGGVRNVAQVVNTDSGNDIEWPTVDDTSNTGELLAENTAATEQDIAFGQKILKAYKYSSKIIRVPLELLNDSAFDLNSFVPKTAGTRIARITNTHFTTGDNSSKPQGVVTYSSAGPTAESATAVGYDDFVELEHSIDPAYRTSESCSWMFADSTLKLAKKLKDADGNPIWVPGMTAGEPDRILNYKYTINQDMAAAAINAKSVLFGDFSFFVVRDVPSFTTVLRLTERYAEYGQVGFLVFTRHDARGVGAEATTATIKHLLHPAA